MSKQILKIQHAPSYKRLLGSLFSILNVGEKKRQNYKKHFIGKYKFVSIAKKNATNKYQTGFYLYKSKKYFIKTWVGNFKDADYYSLINEYLSGKFLYKLLIKNNNNNLFKVPKIIELYEESESLSIVTEYIKGRELSNYSISTQLKIFRKILSDLYLLSQTLSNKEKLEVPFYGKYYYLSIIPLLSLILIIVKPSHIKIIFFAFVKSFSSLLNANFDFDTLAHRDLGPTNVIISRGKIYLIDLEQFALTTRNYDLINLPLQRIRSKYSKILDSKKNMNGYEFLKNYICLHGAVNMRKNENDLAFYLNKLAENTRYGK